MALFLPTAVFNLAFKTLARFAPAVEDPMLAHSLPKIGPWFEGWYTRLVDADAGISIGVITSSSLRTGQRLSVEGPPGYVAALVQTPDLNRTISFEGFPKKTAIGNRGDDFSWTAAGFGSASKAGTALQIANDVRLKIQMNSRKPWSTRDGSYGPEGHLSKLPFLPLHWFVWNAGGEGTYELEYFADGAWRRHEGRGTLHQEKNWGALFPPHWMWLHGENDQAYIALAGGDYLAGPLKTRLYLVGYRSRQANLDFNPTRDWAVTYDETIDATEGTFQFRAERDRYRLEVMASASPDTFASLSIPTLQGFTPNGAIESFNASVKTTLSLNRGTKLLPDWVVVETQTFEQAGLEFGGLNQSRTDSLVP